MAFRFNPDGVVDAAASFGSIIFNLSKIERGDVAPLLEETIRKHAGELAEDPDMSLALGGGCNPPSAPSTPRVAG